MNMLKVLAFRFNSFWDRLPCRLLKGLLKQEVLDIYLRILAIGRRCVNKKSQDFAYF